MRMLILIAALPGVACQFPPLAGVASVDEGLPIMLGRGFYVQMLDEQHNTIYHRAALDALRLVFANAQEVSR